MAAKPNPPWPWPWEKSYAVYQEMLQKEPVSERAASPSETSSCTSESGDLTPSSEATADSVARHIFRDPRIGPAPVGVELPAGPQESPPSQRVSGVCLDVLPRLTDTDGIPYQFAPRVQRWHSLNRTDGEFARSFQDQGGERLISSYAHLNRQALLCAILAHQIQWLSVFERKFSWVKDYTTEATDRKPNHRALVVNIHCSGLSIEKNCRVSLCWAGKKRELYHCCIHLDQISEVRNAPESSLSALLPKPLGFDGLCCGLIYAITVFPVQMHT